MNSQRCTNHVFNLFSCEQDCTCPDGAFICTHAKGRRSIFSSYRGGVSGLGPESVPVRAALVESGYLWVTPNFIFNLWIPHWKKFPTYIMSLGQFNSPWTNISKNGLPKKKYILDILCFALLFLVWLCIFCVHTVHSHFFVSCIFCYLLSDSGCKSLKWMIVTAQCPKTRFFPVALSQHFFQ